MGKSRIVLGLFWVLITEKSVVALTCKELYNLPKGHPYANVSDQARSDHAAIALGNVIRITDGSGQSPVFSFRDIRTGQKFENYRMVGDPLYGDGRLVGVNAVGPDGTQIFVRVDSLDPTSIQYQGFHSGGGYNPGPAATAAKPSSAISEAANKALNLEKRTNAVKAKASEIKVGDTIGFKSAESGNTYTDLKVKGFIEDPDGSISVVITENSKGEAVAMYSSRADPGSIRIQSRASGAAAKVEYRPNPAPAVGSTYLNSKVTNIALDDLGNIKAVRIETPSGKIQDVAYKPEFNPSPSSALRRNADGNWARQPQSREEVLAQQAQLALEEIKPGDIVSFKSLASGNSYADVKIEGTVYRADGTVSYVYGKNPRGESVRLLADRVNPYSVTRNNVNSGSGVRGSLQRSASTVPPVASVAPNPQAPFKPNPRLGVGEKYLDNMEIIEPPTTDNFGNVVEIVVRTPSGKVMRQQPVIPYNAAPDSPLARDATGAYRNIPNSAAERDLQLAQFRMETLKPGQKFSFKSKASGNAYEGLEVQQIVRRQDGTIHYVLARDANGVSTRAFVDRVDPMSIVSTP